MRRWLLLLLAILPLAARGQEGWLGDTDLFVIEEGYANYIEDGKAGRATLYKHFDPGGVPASFSWRFGFYFNDVPTSSNTFEVELFRESLPNYKYLYKVVPDNGGAAVSLVREVYITEAGGNWSRITTQVLSTRSFKFVTSVWSQLSVEVQYAPDKGLRLSTFHPLSGFWQDDWVETRHGTPTWTVQLSTKFTSRKKLGYRYLLPVIVKGNNDTEEPEPVRIVSFHPEDIGRVTLQLSAPVSIQSATVTCPGFRPTLMPGESPDRLVVNLGASFVAHSAYPFEIQHLTDAYGRNVNLSFVVETEAESDGSIAMPQGFHITEVMASPPDEGPLRGIKYIELYNNTGLTRQLAHFALKYGKTTYPLPPITIVDSSFAVLYIETDPPPTRLSTLVPMETFPALSGNFSLVLVDENGTLYDQLKYSSKLYGEGMPKGGASLERVTYNPDTWRRSNHPNGGTPGTRTTLRPFRKVLYHDLVINELLLSPPATGEKYIELYNNSSLPIDLTDLYLTYSNKEESPSVTSWLLVKTPTLLQPGQYAVLSPYPEALPRFYPEHDRDTFIERIDFPAISPTYSEIQLYSHATGESVDHVVYRRQWLGNSSADRTGFSLERIDPNKSGKSQYSWRRASENGSAKGLGGTPGLPNSSLGLSHDSPPEPFVSWPEEPRLEYQQIAPMLRRYSDLSTLSVYSLIGQPLLTATGDEVEPILTRLKQGTADLPLMMVTVVLHFHNPDEDPDTVTYSGVWLHRLQ
ncbi:MAG: lamin tail domain-containing protein [Porphyromonas sp.]|nr:lamin tail domain-containing protein [Porphyromonas sp.]